MKQPTGIRQKTKQSFISNLGVSAALRESGYLLLPVQAAPARDGPAASWLRPCRALDFVGNALQQEMA